jgi:hypothetical protein
MTLMYNKKGQPPNGHPFFLRLALDTRSGLPPAFALLAFSRTLLRFSEALISPDVLGVLEFTRLDGRQYG